MSMDAFNDAKAFLQTASSKAGVSVYDHLSSVISTLLDERPADAVSTLESISQRLKGKKKAPGSSIADSPALEKAFVVATSRAALFTKNEDDYAALDDDDTPQPIADVVETSKLFQDAGIGLGAEESFRVMLALKKLVVEQPVTDVRFWGKIFGTEKDYLIAQCTFREGEEPQPEDAEPEESTPPAEEEEEEGNEKPKSQFVAPKPLSAEEYGSGTNKYVYFVCNEAGEPWTQLPMASPAYIVTARQIKKFFTGNLTKPISSYPPFNGTEADLLRSTIAQISADTHLSPLGLYTFDEDEDEDEDGGRSSYITDEEYEGCAKSALLDASMSGWAHHVQHILPQGRCKWLNPAPPKEEDEDEEDEEEEEEVEPETGPPLLTPAQEDPEVDGQPAWSTRLTMPLNPAYSAVVASSNTWPGAHAVAFAKGKSYENVYIGYGHRFSSEPYSPPLPPPTEAEFDVNETVTETTDPSREEEEQYEAEQAKNDGEDEEEEED
eukprot:m.115188 g.115188  ORF g.115188 m.115188 type:complete len:494 (+) comp17138_c0_seq1:269-1750(+)